MRTGPRRTRTGGNKERSRHKWTGDNEDTVKDTQGHGDKRQSGNLVVKTEQKTSKDRGYTGPKYKDGKME
jgi:hypothetical protein